MQIIIANFHSVLQTPFICVFFMGVLLAFVIVVSQVHNIYIIVLSIYASLAKAVCFIIIIVLYASTCICISKHETLSLF